MQTTALNECMCVTPSVDITLYELGPTRSARVRWVLEEAGLPFESVQNGIDIFKSPGLLEIHPLGKVPAAIIGGKPLFESVAIVTAIVDLVPEKQLIPMPDSWSRNLYNQWVCFALSEMEPFVQSTEINTYDFVLSKEHHVPAIIEQNNLLFRKSATALEQYLSVNEYLIDSHFTAADIVMAYTLCWGQEQQLLSEFLYINQYMDRLYARKDCTLTKP